MMYDKFENLLKERKVSAHQVSVATGVSTATLSSWKQGKYEPKKEKIQKIADYFGVPVSYFYEDSPEYYYDDETARVADMIAVKPGLRLLFDASRDLSEENIRMFAEMIERFKQTNE
jgi:transcriptional regulator with XRE-family HTH domain